MMLIEYGNPDILIRRIGGLEISGPFGPALGLTYPPYRRLRKASGRFPG